MSDPGTQDPFHEPPPPVPRQKFSPRTRLFAAIAASAVAVMAILVWAGYELGKSQSPGEPPLVKAPEGAEKVRPDDPGGIYFEHQDKTVYGAFDGRDEEVEQLLPPAEEPMSKPEPALPAREDADRQMADAREDAGADTTAPAANGDKAPSDMPEITAGDSKPEVTRGVLPPPPAPAPAPEEVRDPVAKTPSPPQPEKKIAKPPLSVPAAPAIKADPPASGDYAVQLGAFRTDAAAEAGWKLLSGKHSGQLGQLSHYVVPVDLGDKGRLYRLQAGPFASRADADEKCAELKKSAVDCLAVRR